MKRTSALILCVFILLSVISFSGCTDAGDDTKGMIFHKMSDKHYSGYGSNPLPRDFIKENKISDKSLIVELTKDASGTVKIPSDYEGKKVVAVVGGKKGNKKITELVIPESVYFIGNCDFPSVSKLKIGSNLKYIDYSFNSCNSITELKLPECVIKSSFDSCKNLKSISLPKGVTEIRGSFSHCSSVKSVELYGIKVLLRSFEFCDSLKSVKLKGNIERIVDSFNDCKLLEDFEFDGKAEAFYSSFKNCDKLTEKLNNYDLTKGGKAKKLTGKSRIIFFNESAGKYEYGFEMADYKNYDSVMADLEEYEADGTKFSTLFALSPKEADVVIKYGGIYISQPGTWVSPGSGDYIRDAYAWTLDYKICSLDKKQTTIASGSVWRLDSYITEDNFDTKKKELKESRALDDKEMMGELVKKVKKLIK